MAKEMCVHNEDCRNYPFEVCGSSLLCEHKDVFPVYSREFLGLLVLSLLMALSTVAGIGGGGVVTPMCMTFFTFSTKHAISISGFSILVCSLVKFVMCINQKHPQKDCVVIDYGMATIMLPTVLMGSLMGVLFNVMLPALLLQAILTLLLFFLALQSGRKAYEIF